MKRVIAIVFFLSTYSLICEAQNPFTNILNRFKCGNVHCDDLVVQLKQGKLQGRAYESVLNKDEYYAFLGIPYAKPPLGELRFQAPQPPQPWRGVYDATYERSMCQQANFMTSRFVKGSEDCLHLNVYTPRVPRKIEAPKPVMVSIHGGGFCRGSGTRRAYSADYLITRDIILVSINYRLLILGFLNLGLPNCSGNVGLKDQTQALKWVKENISKFGGDPDNITIFGESAGASSVHYHLLSPLSRGLFHKAIMQSGSALSPWAITYNPIEQAFEIGRLCGFRGNDTEKLLHYLKNQPGHVITTAAVEMILRNREIHPARLVNISPSVEMIQQGAFLPDRLENLMKNATLVPTIFGVNDREGILLFLDMNRNVIQKLHDDFSIFVKDNFKVNPDSVSEVSRKIKRFYFGNEDVGANSASQLVDLYSDLYFYYVYEAMEFLTNSTTPPYVYEFSYDGQLNYFKRLVNFLRRTKLKGASHADELFYLFYPQVTPFHRRIDDESSDMINIMTTMWSNFAKTGNPSDETEWKPSTSREPCYLRINNSLEMVPGKLYEKRLSFLKNILEPALVSGAEPYNIF